MTKRKNIFIGIIALLVIGVVLVYYVAFRDDKKSENDHSRNEYSANEPLTHSKPENIPTGAGAKPAKNPKDGSIKIIEDFVKSNAKNPTTFEFLEWSEVSSEDGYWKVRCKYRGVSSFNAEVTTNAWFYIKNNKVVYTKIISKV